MAFTPVFRVTFSLVLLTASLLFLAQMFGFAPDRSEEVRASRKHLTEVLAIQFAAAAQREEVALIKETLQTIVSRENDIRSAALRDPSGELLAQAGDHLAQWQAPPEGRSTLTHVQIPVFRGDKRWATVEISFASLEGGGFLARLKNSYLGLILFVLCTGFAGFFLLLKRALRELDPSSVIPERVRAAFDALKEGVLIFDEREQIVLANTSFAGLVGGLPAELVGVKGSELPWKEGDNRADLPWMRVLGGEEAVAGSRLTINRGEQEEIALTVNAVPVVDNKGNRRGVLATFDDITELERRNQELNRTISKLNLTSEEVQSKNRELEFLASHDPLTLLLNRRALNREFERLFTVAQRHGRELACIMCDIDHFKQVNDRYGHAAGDRVIRMVAALLGKNFREMDLIGRYGGEEFCIVLPDISLERAAVIANRVREVIQADDSTGIRITMSFGLSSLQFKPQGVEELTGQADKALYVAKESGRNRVICWGEERSAKAPATAAAEKPKVPDKQQVALTAITTGPEAGDDRARNRELLSRLRDAEALAEKRLQELKYFEMYDSATGLPTRTIFYDRLAHALNRLTRQQGMVAVLSVANDAVHRIRETLGHEAGDRLFVEIVQRLKNTLRAADTIANLSTPEATPTVTRLGQDEFGILLIDIEDVNSITWIIRRIFTAFAEGFQVEGNEVRVALNVGIAVGPNDGQEPEELEKNAAAARSHARSTLGANTYSFYADNIHAGAIRHLKMESQLYRAVENNEFVLHYQPKITSASGAICGFEALVRWNDPATGLVPPGDFIPVAEHSGLIVTIGEWVLATACRQMRAWLDLGLADCSVAVNFSSQQFRQRDLVANIRTSLEANGLDPRHLLVEITENVFMDKSPYVLKTFNALKELGVRIALDDFGTSYSSLGYLKDFPVHSVKIDRSFVKDIESDARDNALVRSIISMAHNMGLAVTAEGVETAVQRDLLNDLGCDEMQGYFFSRPVPEAEASGLLRAGTGLWAA